MPAIVVSPFVARGSVFNTPPGAASRGWSEYTPYDHTSILRTIENCFGYEPLTPRDAAAPDLGGILTQAARTDYGPVPLATIPALDAEADIARQPLNDLQVSIVAGLAHLGAPLAAEALPRTVGQALDFFEAKKRELKLT